jgi:hydrogenase maturation factor HypF (carbamoyltransferase family)
MGGAQGTSPRSKKKRKKPTDLFCKSCLEEIVFLEVSKRSYYPDRLYQCERCKRRYTRSQVLTFDETTRAKFERTKHKPQSKEERK